MRKITVEDIKNFKQGDKLVQVVDSNVEYWEFLMVHPHNSSYVLLLNNLSQDAFKFYIPNLINSNFYNEYDLKEVYKIRIEELKREMVSCEETIKRLEASK